MRLSALALALCLLISLMPAAAFAETEMPEVQWGTDTNYGNQGRPEEGWKAKKDDGTIYIQLLRDVTTVRMDQAIRLRFLALPAIC